VDEKDLDFIGSLLLPEKSGKYGITLEPVSFFKKGENDI